MKRRSSYKLAIDHLDQAAKELAANTCDVVRRRDELRLAEGVQQESELRLAQLLISCGRGYVVVDKVKYVLEGESRIRRELQLY